MQDGGWRNGDSNDRPTVRPPSAPSSASTVRTHHDFPLVFNNLQFCSVFTAYFSDLIAGGVIACPNNSSHDSSMRAPLSGPSSSNI